jgi:hypothetical protein
MRPPHSHALSTGILQVVLVSIAALLLAFAFSAYLTT